MKKIFDTASRYWLWVVIGLLLTRKAMSIAYLERGYMAVGGEIFVLPFVLVFASIIYKIYDRICSIMDKEAQNEKLH